MDWWLTNNRNSFLTILETDKSKTEAPADSMSGVDLLTMTSIGEGDAGGMEFLLEGQSLHS